MTYFRFDSASMPYMLESLPFPSVVLLEQGIILVAKPVVWEHQKLCGCNCHMEHAVQEARQFEGRVLVAREAESPSTGGSSHVVDTYEPVAGDQRIPPSCPALSSATRSPCVERFYIFSHCPKPTNTLALCVKAAPFNSARNGANVGLSSA